jgi:hypothetical protein
MLRTLSMRRLAVVTAVTFLIVFAFLAGRVRAGADPTQTAAPAASTPQAQSAPPTYPDDGIVPTAPDPNPPVTHAS